MTTQRIIVLSDVHLPFHAPNAVELAIQVIKVWQPDRVIFNGDIMDFYAVSTHDKNPERLKNGGLQTELEQWYELADKVRSAAPADCQIDFLPGNHEDRLRRYLWRDSTLHGLQALELPSLLKLGRFGIAFHEHEINLAGGALVVKHGSYVRRYSGMSAKAELEAERYSVSGISGHVHRLGHTQVRTRRGIVGWWEGGCLCDLNPEYVRNPDWHHGVTLVWAKADGEAFNVQSIPFFGNKALIDGREVRA